VRPESAELLSRAMGGEGDRVAMRFGRGCRAFARIVDDEVVAYGWLSAGREWVGELAVYVEPAPGEAYVWNCFTVEAHRRRGHYRRVLEGIVSVARSEGLRRLWIGSVDVPAEKADSDSSTFGMLLRDRQLYDQMHGSVRELNQLVRDIKENPHRYLKFSLF